MDKKILIERFNSLLDYLPVNLKKMLFELNDELKISVQEIRLRAGRPLTVTMGGSQFFVCRGGTYMLPRADSVYVTAADLNDCFLKLCKHSVYSHNSELCEGYISLAGGHRAGVCGKVVERGGKIETIRDISSINLRIAKEIPHSADEILKHYNGGGILICGGPGTGKTTLLRDICRQLASGRVGGYKKVAVVDSRGEIAAVSDGIPNTDMGSTADIITGVQKAKGIEMALRTLFPDVIAFDELGDMNEVSAVTQCFNSGVTIITTAHIGSMEDLIKRSTVSALLKTGAIEWVVMCHKGFNFRIENINQLDFLKKELAVI
ncbi:MAG: AAA family ATPase [Ruminococcaceae bacterium]|nr:AAA family ATPase [Oscillospiraceae bacterium]